MQTLCIDCARSKRRGPLVRGFVALLLLGATASGGYWAYQTYKPRYDYGPMTEKVHALESSLKTEPCDRPKTLELLEVMLTAGDSRGVIERARAFSAQCGEYPRTREITFRAHQRLGEMTQAITDLDVLVESEPYRYYYRGWRGVAFQDMGELEKAAEDFRQALLLYPQLMDLPLNLAAVYEKQGKFCEAAFPLQQLVFHHHDKPWANGIKERIASLLQKGDCGVSGEGRVVLRMEPDRSSIQAKVRIDDKETATFVVDTGASYVTVTRALATKLGLALNGAPRVTLTTANGKREGIFTVLNTVAVDKLTAKRVPAVVIDDLGPGTDGLLGLSFLSRFEMRQANGVVELGVPTAQK